MKKTCLKDKIPLELIDKIRQDGFRPQVVACITSGKKILFVYKAKHQLWQLPQGGIENGENIEQAVLREMSEELGEDFVKRLTILSVLGEDSLKFPKKTAGLRHLQTDNGEEKQMLGKKYFFVLLRTNSENIDINQTEFDGYVWVDLAKAKMLANSIHQPGKKRLTGKIVNLVSKYFLKNKINQI